MNLRGYDEPRMLRRRKRIEVFEAVFSKAGWRGHGWPERDARLLAAGGRCDADAEQEAACRALSARGGGRFERCGSFRRAKLLPAEAEHRDSPAEARRNRCGGRSGRIFWVASQPCAARAFVPPESAGYSARGGIAGSDALAFRRAGFYGVGNARREGDR